jgi:DNA processing protein
MLCKTRFQRWMCLVSDTKHWLGFSLVPEIGPKRLHLLLKRFDSLFTAWHASEYHLRQAGLEETPTANLLHLRAQIDLDAELAKVERVGARICTFVDDNYPHLLKEVPDAPVLLYIRGTLLPQDELALAIVGTRKATTYGRDAASHLARQLARNGVTIISGLAHGIDAAAHRGALEGGGRTIAVLGCGIDQIYPRDHRDLAHEIMGRGALVTEFPIGMGPEARNFPRRNRVISGLSLGVLVAEAPEQSGALITATDAAEQGREVFAIPGNIFSPASAGTNRLIQDGAKLVINVEDILDELDIAHRNVQTKTVAERIAPTGEIETTLLGYLSLDPLHIDDLARMCGLPITTVTSTLTLLELKGLARSVGPMQYSLTVDR